MSTNEQRQKTKRRNAWLPIMGLTLAILIGVMSYFLAPALLDFARSQSSDLDEQVSDFENDPQGGLPSNAFEIMMSAVLWFVTMAILMFIAAGTIGEDPEKESWKTMGPPPANKKAVTKDMKKRQQEIKKKQRERSRQPKNQG